MQGVGLDAMLPPMDGWLLAHLAATWAMVGFIWMIQIVQISLSWMIEIWMIEI